MELLNEDYRDILARNPSLDFIDIIFLIQIQKLNNAVMKDKLGKTIPFDIKKDFGFRISLIAKSRFSSLSLDKLPETYSLIEAHSSNYGSCFLDLLVKYRNPTNTEIERFLNQIQPDKIANICRNRNFVAKYNSSFSSILIKNPDFIPIIIDLKWPAQSPVHERIKPINLTIDLKKASQCAKDFIENADAQIHYSTLDFLTHNKRAHSFFKLDYSDVMKANEKLASYMDNMPMSHIEAMFEFVIDETNEYPITTSYDETENKQSWLINTALLEEWMTLDMKGFLSKLLLNKETMTWTATVTNQTPCLLDYLSIYHYGEYHVNIDKNIYINLNNSKISNFAKALTLKSRKSFEKLLEDYLNKILGPRFLVENNWRILLPDKVDDSVKCKNIIPIFEQIFKTYVLYCTRKSKTSFDEVNFQQTSPDISTMMSYRQASFICPREDNNYRSVVNALFSFSSAFASDDGEIESFYDWLLHSPSLSLNEDQIKELEPLIQNDLVSISKGKLSLSQAQQEAIIFLYHLAFGNEVWLSGDDALSYTSISILSQHQLCNFSSRLFTRKEAELLNYLMNDKMFSNSSANRNIYSHGYIGNTEENNENYILILQALCFVAVRIDLDFELEKK